MKKYILYSLCVLIIAILCVGCDNNSGENISEGDLVNQIHVTSNNDIFTDTFFDGLKEIHFHYYDNIYDDKPLTSTKDMQNVCDILANLTLVEKDKEIIYGTLGLTFTFTDGSEKTITFTSSMLTYEENAFITDKDICEAIEALFES